MEINERVDHLEDEVKVLKNEVQVVLLDIRESYLNRENPFNPEVSSPTLHSVAATISGPSSFGSESGPSRGNDNTKQSNEVEQPPAVVEQEPESTKPVPAVKQAKVATASEEQADEEVSKAPRSEEKPEVTDMQPGSNGHSNGNGRKYTNGKIDLVTISNLAKWANETATILGPATTETVLDFAELTGHLPAEIKNILVKLVYRIPLNSGNNGNSNGNGNGHTNNSGKIPSARQLVLSIIELEGLLGMNNKSDELTLLTMVCQEVEQSTR